MTIRRDPLDPNERELVREGAPSPAGPRRAYMPELPDGADLTQEVVRFDGGSRVPGQHGATDLTKDPAGVPDPAQVEVPAALRAEIEDFMSRYPDSRSAAIPALAAAQRVHGWCSPQAVEQVACVMRLTPAYLTAVVGFYDMLEGTEVGRQTVYVCTNISCSLRGADDLLASLKGEIGDHPDVNIRGFECLGACDIAPMCSVNGTYVGPIDADEVPELARQIISAQDPLPGKQLVRRRVADVAANSDDVARASLDSGTLDPVSLDGGRSA
ncbi:NAD(P)H-dependent oxidoreductase subunit E [Patulibacter sp.]|uniref:NADH-quinone oxidoreductase subunit NuoE family protein n=1 Tax=Patulibacter sp. TaxID=1912859 RepID=UPI002728FF49|nr:NAD(P)H-dependent oxidoreductase subunit E [Patulibacter sp.]MDO9407214.1 NAD(P)H-dependent oxidoreductase subunit E [Patulibacter sp.]